jgi:hypothetical protein
MSDPAVSTDVSEEHTATVFRVERLSAVRNQQEVDSKQCSAAFFSATSDCPTATDFYLLDD